MYKKTYVVLMIIGLFIFGLFTTSVQAAGSSGGARGFVDTQSHWASGQIGYLADLGIIDGVGEGRFEPEWELTRAQLVKMMVVSLELSTVQADPTSFVDIDDHWATPYIEAAVKADILIPEEYGDRFYPDRNITRLEIAEMVVRAMGMTNPEDVPSPDFGDLDDVEPANREFIGVAWDRGIIAGYPAQDGNRPNFKPDACATRAEATVMLVRMLRGTQSPTAVNCLGEMVPDAAVVDMQDCLVLNFSGGHFLMINPETAGDPGDLVVGLDASGVSLEITEEELDTGCIDYVPSGELRGTAAETYPEGIYTVAVDVGDRRTGYIKPAEGMADGDLTLAFHRLRTAYPWAFSEQTDYWILSFGKHALMWAKTGTTQPPFMLILDAGAVTFADPISDGTVAMARATYFPPDDFTFMDAGGYPDGVYVIPLSAKQE